MHTASPHRVAHERGWSSAHQTKPQPRALDSSRHTAVAAHRTPFTAARRDAQSIPPDASVGSPPPPPPSVPSRFQIWQGSPGSAFSDYLAWRDAEATAAVAEEKRSAAAAAALPVNGGAAAPLGQIDILVAEGGVAASGTSQPGPKVAADKARRALSQFEVEQLARIEVIASGAYCQRVAEFPPSPFSLRHTHTQSPRRHRPTVRHSRRPSCQRQRCSVLQPILPCNALPSPLPRPHTLPAYACS